MVGLPFSGKTTLGELEQQYSALRLTPDEWHTRLFGQDVDEKDHDHRHNVVEALLWDVAARVLVLGVDVILLWILGAQRTRRFSLASREIGSRF
jgi:predicted kinase